MHPASPLWGWGGGFSKHMCYAYIHLLYIYLYYLIEEYLHFDCYLKLWDMFLVFIVMVIYFESCVEYAVLIYVSSSLLGWQSLT